MSDEDRSHSVALLAEHLEAEVTETEVPRLETSSSVGCLVTAPVHQRSVVEGPLLGNTGA